jgi:hypothetical protein
MASIMGLVMALNRSCILLAASEGRQEERQVAVLGRQLHLLPPEVASV